MNNSHSIPNPSYSGPDRFENLVQEYNNKRNLEAAQQKSAKRVKRHSESKKIKELSEEISVLSEVIKSTKDEVLRAKTIGLVTTKQLEELRILHVHLRDDANKLYLQKKEIASECQQLKIDLEETKKQNKEKEKQLADVAKLYQNYIDETHAFKEKSTKETSAYEATIWQLNVDLKSEKAKSARLDSDLDTKQKEIEKLTKSLEDKTMEASATRLQMIADFESSKKELMATAEETRKKETEKLKDKIKQLSDANKKLSAENKKIKSESAALISENATLNDSILNLEATHLVMRTQNDRLVRQKEESDAKYQSLLKNISSVIESHK